ncbi:UDP-4-amino-4,6-dideoxy-N-acetyl-beta-L-altrosamine transaminase [Legionella pneumophila subsp. fraseri]|nr:UDP-4-amino-4,6-dideoxy-N-acetyl-beta-L-altrosamine transaminase [Legionella pneumophila]MDW8879099.1 UDP-4-amino-4,6-dideoxy-N-acetyl-beta-L-altrosamine transaminase [Legionella pneumophila subsp. fraseri]MDW8961577.1 UDP-4-amino-4,6-dideoxy-N-acetyl-beta-L-altrosamine transaminase [Legionella pneumophila subsp. fraseri]HAT1798060.1 UDP-4-amino-4,6-dideoxy-N-acetyl-beta-L-altrosamine transaminase [Legionella pneumophila]HAT1847423.1 UDP-4-amino-4,6-dideoxy-N-acetyl-beta-L-altrosamine transa
MDDWIPYGRHAIDENDVQAVINVLKSDWLTCGPSVEQFENKICEVTQADYAVACSNGTTALHLALLALDIKKGDQVIVPAITFLATANAVRYVDAEVIFADVDPESGLMTAETLERAIQNSESRTNLKAIINVHFAGQCENLEEIAAVAKKYNLRIIDDSAHAIGTNYINNKGASSPIGSGQYCDLATFSFHPVKTIALGEGGAITTKNSILAEKIRMLRSHGMIRNEKNWENKIQAYDEYGNVNPWYYEMQEIGYNYRVTDISCALGYSQLQKIDSFKSARQKIVSYYDDHFKNSYFQGIKKNIFSQTAWHLYVLRINFKLLNKSRAQVMKYLAEHQIGTQVHYIPVYRQPYYEARYGKQTLPGAEAYYEMCLSIPLFVNLRNDQQEYIVQKIKSLAK